MGIKTQITEVNEGARFISFMQDGVSQVKEVVFPAQMKYVRLGKAEVGFNPEGKVNFVKSTEPKKEQISAINPTYKKLTPYAKPTSTMENIKNRGLDDIQAMYNEINARDNAECRASTLTYKGGEMYDMVFYVTTSAKKA